MEINPFMLQSLYYSHCTVINFITKVKDVFTTNVSILCLLFFSRC